MTGWVTVNLGLANSTARGIGYVMGFADLLTASTRIDQLEFSTEAISQTAASLPIAIGGTGGFNSSTKGYAAGGFSASMNDSTNLIQNLTFSSLAVAVNAAVLATAPYKPGSVNSDTAGYVGTGALFSGGNFVACYTQVCGLRYSTETSTGVLTNITVAREFVAGINSSSRGYFGGGYNQNVTYSTIDGIQFSTETGFGTSANLSSSRASAAGVNSGSSGYFGGGGNVSNSVFSTIDGFRFSTETSVSVSASMAQAVENAAGVNSIVNGYFISGDAGYTGFVTVIPVTNTSGINFSTETNHTLGYTTGVMRWACEGVQSGGIL